MLIKTALDKPHHINPTYTIAPSFSYVRVKPLNLFRRLSSLHRKLSP